MIKMKKRANRCGCTHTHTHTHTYNLKIKRMGVLKWYLHSVKTKKLVIL
jgi:hypothetical protein